MFQNQVPGILNVFFLFLQNITIRHNMNSASNVVKCWQNF